MSPGCSAAASGGSLVVPGIQKHQGGTRMPSAPVFISHASSDDAFVRKLRQALEGFNIPVWVDSSNLRGGNALTPAIAEAIAEARHVLVVLSPQTINSSWLRREIR